MAEKNNEKSIENQEEQADKRIAEDQAQEKGVDVDQQLDKKTKEAADYLETLQRLKADFENYKKRMMKEQANFMQFASEDLILKLLPVLDNFERALYISEELKEHQNIFKGFEMIYGELLAVLEKEGLKEVEASGEFDPELYEAVMQVDEEGFSENHIVDVLRKGYIYKGKLIRPSMVKVQRSS